MNVLIFNKSRKKSFRQTKRLISAVLPQISNRLNIGDIPKRVILKMIEDLRKIVNRGTCIEIYIEDRSGYMGFRLINIGKIKGINFFSIPQKNDKFFIP